MLSNEKTVVEHADNAFINFIGTNNISTTQGAGAQNGPQNTDTVTDGWDYYGMIKIQINGTDYWTPCHTFQDV
jgi:hypothetical protein